MMVVEQISGQIQLDPPVRISINRVEVISGALFLANVLTVPLIILIVIAVVSVALFVADFDSRQFLSMGFLLIFVPLVVWVFNFIFGIIVVSITNLVLKFNKPKVLMQQLG